MPKSMSHVVVFTDDLDAVVEFVTGTARLSPVSWYEASVADISALFGWPIEAGPARGAFIGEGPGSLDLLEIPASLRGSVSPGPRLLAIVNRDVAGAGAAASEAGHVVRGPFHTTAATGNPMSLVEIIVGGVPFELAQFG